MTYLGRYLLGQRVPLLVRCLSAAGAPAVPDQAPAALVYSPAALVLAVRLPVRDRQDLAGLFGLALLLDSRFGTGPHRVLYQYTVGGVAGADAATFEVVPGGHADGAGLSLCYYARPASDFCLVQTDSGRIVRRRNPRLA